MTDVPVPRLNTPASRFEIATPHGKAVLKFAERNGTIDLQHTSVPAALEGGGYGSALARAALDHARQNALKVIPTCRFVRTFMKRHHEYDDLLASPA
ncbi:MAG: N-acetyltransferase [Gemmatimonadota bacterium]|nr:N-acetyltransferase [Gemmatimonadota bacterium]